MFGTEGFGSDEPPEGPAPALRLRPGFSTASSAAAVRLARAAPWPTWSEPVCALRDCGDGSLEEELAAAEELVVESDLGPIAGEPPTVVERDESEAPEPKRLRVS